MKNVYAKATFFILSVSSLAAVAETFSLRPQLSEFLDKQGFPKQSLTEQDILKAGLTSQTEKTKGGASYKEYRLPSLAESTSGYGVCTDAAANGRFYEASAGDTPIVYPGGRRSIPRSIEKLITASENRVVDPIQLFKTLEAKLGSPNSVARTDSGIPAQITYHVKHHGFPVVVTFLANDRGCLRAFVSYRRYSEEYSPTEALTRALK